MKRVTRAKQKARGTRSTRQGRAKQTAVQGDAAKVDPSHYAVELENKRVRVLRIRYGPREKSVMHSHPPGVAVFLTAHAVRFTYPDGRAEEVRVNAGGVQWLPTTTHLPENLNDQPLELVLVELKG